MARPLARTRTSDEVLRVTVPTPTQKDTPVQRESHKKLVPVDHGRTGIGRGPWIGLTFGPAALGQATSHLVGPTESAHIGLSDQRGPVSLEGDPRRRSLTFVALSAVLIEPAKVS